MRNNIRILPSAVFLVCIMLSFGLLSTSCKNKTEEATETVKDIDDFLDDTSEEITDLTDLTTDEFEEEQSYEDLDEESQDISDLTDLTEPVTNNEPITNSVPDYEPAPVSKPATTYNSGGNYLLVAGNYSIHSNAESMRSKLTRMGYDSAEIVNFDNSTFSTVLASRFNDYEAAVRASSALKNRGIDCYVHTRKD